jgi:hypothetical protein
MRTIYTTIAAVSLLTLLHVSTVQAFDEAFSASINCSIDDQMAPYGPRGISTHYIDSSQRNFLTLCSFSRNQALDTRDDMLVRYVDANANPGGNVICSFRSHSPDDADVLYYPTKYSCATVGGCTSEDNVFSSSSPGYLRISDVRLGDGYSLIAYCLFPGANFDSIWSEISNFYLRDE